MVFMLPCLPMQDVIPFLGHHWLLTGLLVILLILLFLEEAKAKGLTKQLGPAEVVQLINRESAVVIDIRNRDAFKTGHIVGSFNFPQSELEKDFSKLSKYKDRPLVIVYATGQKAGEIMMKLKKQGFTNVQVMSGGINAWTNAQMPLVKK